MVTFNNGSFSIEIKTANSPIENWLLLHDQLVRMIEMSMGEEDLVQQPWMVMELVNSMMPDIPTAEKMFVHK